MDLDETAKELTNEFSVFMNPKNLSKMTPHVCREGCKYYDPIGDPESGSFREFCGKSNEALIERGRGCENFEPSVATPEPVEDEFQKIQGGNGQENHVNALFKGVEGALL